MGQPGIRRAAAVIAAVCAVAIAPRAQAERVSGMIEISFAASSTLHDFEGTADPIRITGDSQPDGTWSSEVVVPVETLDTGIDARDHNLLALLDAKHHPEIRGHIRGLDADRLRATSRLPFVLRIRDVEKPMEATVTKWQQPDDRHARFDADFDVSLESFGLEAPHLLFVSVGDTVHVTVHVTLERI